MTKIIHPYQLLEAPQVNILNNNIVEDVNYSYENSEIVLTTIKRFFYVGYKPVYDGEGNITSYRDVSQSTYDNSDIYDISVTEGTEDGMYYKRISFKFDCDSSSVVGLDSRGTNQGLEFNNASMSYYKYYKYWGGQSGWVYNKRSSDLENVDFSTVLARILGDVTSVVKNGDIYTIALSVVLVYDNVSSPSGGSDTNRAEHFLNEFSFDVQVKTINQTLTQIDTNSNLSIESNELMQQNTKVNNTTQISEYIADNIKTHYADGKATISMQVVDDGTQEYDVHDIVIPKIQTKFGIYNEGSVDNISINISNYNGSVITYNGDPYFLGKINNYWVIFCDCIIDGLRDTRTVIKSLDLSNWQVVAIDLVANTAFLANEKIFFARQLNDNASTIYYAQNLNELSNPKTITLQTPMFITSIKYLNGKYYIVGFEYSSWNESYLYVINNEELGSNLSIEEEMIFDVFMAFDVELFSNKLYVCGRDRNNNNNIGAILEVVDDSSYSIVFQTSSVMTLTEIVASPNSIVSSYTGGGRNGYYSTDGINWTQKYSGGGTYNSYINAYVSTYGGNLVYSKDPSQEWTVVAEDVVTGSKIVLYNDVNGVVVITGYVNGGQVAIVEFYGTVHPLLTNADGSAKEFEITSSELVYDGLTYYNLEAVEST